MPELPEVENIAIGLRKELIGKRIVRLEVFNEGIIGGQGRRGEGKSSWASDIGKLEGQVVTSVARRAKRLIIGLDKAGALLFQLGMTGQLMVIDTCQPRAKHTHLVATLDDGREIRFVDIRRFGRVWVLGRFDVDWSDANRCDEAMREAGLSKLGGEPLVLKLSEFRELLKSKRAIKTLLLDQKVIAGLGNIYTDEVLFAAGVHPLCPAEKVSKQQAEQMLRAMKRILNKAIKYGGTTFSDYRNAYGQKGAYKRFLQVYTRAGEQCYKCGTVISKIKVGGRSSCFCPGCQGDRIEN